MPVKYSDEELLYAIGQCLKNANELILDADILQKNNRIPRSYTLYQLAMEEAGKVLLIFSNLIFNTINTPSEIRKFQKEFNNHISKAQNARMVMLLFSQDIKRKFPEIAEKFKAWTLNEAVDPNILNDFKNFSLYTSYYQNEFKTPNEIITIERLNYIQIMSKARVAMVGAISMFSNEHLITMREYVKNNPLTEEKKNEIINEFINNNIK